MDFRAKSWGAKSWSLGRCLLPLLLILLCCLTLPAPLQAAVDIQITYDPKPGEEDEAPGWDPNGDQLVTMFNAAASVWEGYLIGNTTYHVPVSWDADLGDSTLGEAMPSAPFDIDILSDPMTLENNPAPWFVDSTPLDHSEFNFSGPAYNELAGNNNNWGGQTLYRDLGANNQNDWFNGNPPDLLEVGFRGLAIAGGGATGQYDLFTTVIHELGHRLGVNYDSDVLDPDWEPQPSQVGGNTMGIEYDYRHIAGTTALMAKGQGKPNRRRLPSAIDLLAVDDDEDAITGVDLPRQDFLGNASEPNDALTTIWNIPSNWEGGTLPDQDDDAFVRPPTGSITLTGDATVKSLLIDESTSLDVQQNTLIVTGATSLIATNATDIRGSSSLVVPAGGIFSSGGTMRVADLAEIHLLGGQLRATDQIVTITGGTGDGGIIRGHGQIELDGTTASIVNNGTIRTDSLPTGITIHNASGSVTVASSTIDLDGTSEGGSVHVDTGDLTITPYVHVADKFEGEMTVAEGRTFSVGSHDFQTHVAWQLASGGSLLLDGGYYENGAAVVSDGNHGGTFVVHGQISVPSLARGHLETKAIIEADALIEPEGVLRLAGHTTFGSSNGLGPTIGQSFAGGTPVHYAIEQYGDAAVTGDTHIILEVYDWDGDESSPSSMHISPLKTLTLGLHSIDYADGYDGSTYVHGAKLDVRTSVFDEPTNSWVDDSWQIDPGGTVQLENAILNTEGATNFPSELTGSAVVVEGTIRAMGRRNEITSDHFTLRPGGAIELEGIAYQDLSAPGTPTVTDPGQLSMPAGGVTYSGGTITGAGVIHHEGPILVNGDVSAEVSTFDFDGQQTTLGNQINIQGGRLQVKAAALQDGINTDLVSSDFEINNGALLVSRVADPLALGPPSDYLAWKLKSFSEIELAGSAALSASDDLNNLAKFGSEMQVAGLVKASGSGNTIYAPTRVLQGGQIVAENDQLEIAGNTTVAAGGVVQANAGGGIRFSKPLFLEGGGTLWADGRVLLEGGTYLQGGTLEGNAAIRSDSDLFVEQPSTSNVKYLDLDGANEAQTLRLQADFTVNAESIEYSWTSVNNPITAELPKFDGSIDVNAPATLTMNIGNASAGDIWILDGAVWVDANLDDGVGEGKGLNIAGSPFQFCNTSIHIGAGSWLNIDADASGIFQPVQGGGEMKFNANWSPGKSPAALSFAGDLGFGPDARVIMEIYRSLEADGSDPFGQLYGTDPFDSFEVAGLIDLGGATLEVIFQDGFQPVAGQSFPLFAASSILGSFSTIIPRGLPQGLMLDASGLSGGFLSVAVSPEPTAVLLLLLGLALLPRRRRR